MKKSKNYSTKLKKRLIVLASIFVAIAAAWAVYGILVRDYVDATDSTGTISYKYPENWALETYIWENCCSGPPKSEPNWSQESKPITLHPVEDKTVKVTIVAEKYGDYWKSYDELKNSVKEDYFANILFDGVREDGHMALFTRVDYLGPPDAKVESFTDHRYYFDNGTTVLRVEFREKYHHDWPDEETGPDIDNTKFLSDFEQIAESIKFAN